MIPTQEPRYLSAWARRKYEACIREAKGSRGQDRYTDETAWSLFRAAYLAGRKHLFNAIRIFFLKKFLDAFEEDFDQLICVSSPSLWNFSPSKSRAQRPKVFMFEDLHSEHVASVQKDFARAVLPAMKGYQLPAKSQDMALPALIHDGLEQYERSIKRRCQSKLPKGLFEFGIIGSARCQPSLYLRTSSIRSLGDVYGALSCGSYSSLVGHSDSVKLRLREKERPPASRLPNAKTYVEAFGNKSTAESSEFMKAIFSVSDEVFGNFGENRIEAHVAWAMAVVCGETQAPLDKWPSPAHETAIFAQSLLHTEQVWASSWPEIDHERVCFELMCDFASIHPDVAREKNLGLVVKVEEPPCIGFVNSAVYGDMIKIEQFQRGHDIGTPMVLAAEGALLPQDWLTVLISDVKPPVQGRALTFEAMRIQSPLVNSAVEDSPKSVLMQNYNILGVWFWCGRDDSCIGAELARGRGPDCDAILV